MRLSNVTEKFFGITLHRPWARPAATPAVHPPAFTPMPDLAPRRSSSSGASLHSRPRNGPPISYAEAIAPQTRPSANLKMVLERHSDTVGRATAVTYGPGSRANADYLREQGFQTVLEGAERPDVPAGTADLVHADLLRASIGPAGLRQDLHRSYRDLRPGGLLTGRVQGERADWGGGMVLDRFARATVDESLRSAGFSERRARSVERQNERMEDNTFAPVMHNVVFSARKPAASAAADGDRLRSPRSAG